MDDASRFVVALEAHHTEREADMLGLFLATLRRHGAPDGLYLDNGSTYRGETLRIGCERLGVTLIHARPYVQQFATGNQLVSQRSPCFLVSCLERSPACSPRYRSHRAWPNSPHPHPTRNSRTPSSSTLMR